MTSEASSDTLDDAPGRSRPMRGLLRFLRDLVVVVLVALVISFVVKTFVVRSFYIPSASMEQTLQINDRILVDELTPRWNPYERGDIVVFADPGGWLPPSARHGREGLLGAVDSVLTFVGLGAGDSEEHLVKRIIGLPGDRVVCCNGVGQLTVNDRPIDESSYLFLPGGQNRGSEIEFDVTVPDDAIWVLGDNRNRSQDSRYNTGTPGEGFVPLENVVGRVVLMTWPLNRIGPLDSHHDVFDGIPAP